MIQTEQLSNDTIIFHIQGPFYSTTAKDLSLAVWNSYRFGFKTYLCDISHASLIDNEGSRHLAIIGKGLEEKGGTWKVIGTPAASTRQASLQSNLHQLSKESWN